MNQRLNEFTLTLLMALSVGTLALLSTIWPVGSYAQEPNKYILSGEIGTVISVLIYAVGMLVRSIRNG